MLFNSLEFPLFLGLTMALFYLLRDAGRQRILLLVASLFFYGYWKWSYLFLLMASSGIDYLAALGIDRSKNQGSRRAWLILSLLGNLSILAFFKYSAFFGKAFIFRDGEVPDWVPVVLPVGISFYTFQAMSYVIDVYRSRMKAEKSWTSYMLFITFFPQLVAGPIERAPQLLDQLNKPFLNPDILPGLILIASGFFKKLLIADRLAVYADAVFNRPDAASAPQLILATLFFGFQIYCDFSGYSDIARGCASFFGVELMANFRSPYAATDLGDFWRRWHISLSGWFRDYLYHPLGGNRQSKARSWLNLFIVFCVSGLWHGANWTFLLWGAWHGFGLVMQRILTPVVKMPVFFSRMLCLFWVFSGWFFFRVNNLEDAIVLFRKLNPSTSWSGSEINLFHSVSEMSLALLSCLMLLLAERKSLKEWTEFIQNQKLTVKLSLALTAFSLLLWFGHFKGGDFIYFQF